MKKSSWFRYELENEKNLNRFVRDDLPAARFGYLGRIHPSGHWLQRKVVRSPFWMNPCQLPLGFGKARYSPSSFHCKPTLLCPQQLLNPPTCHANVCVDMAKQFCVQNNARLLKMTQLLWPPKPLQPKLFCWLSTCSRWKLGPAKVASVFTTKNQKQWNSESSQSCCLQPLSNQVSSWPCTIKVWDPDSLNSEGFQHDLQCWVICTCFVAIYRHQKSHSKQHSIQRLIT